MTDFVSQINGNLTVYSTVCLGWHQGKDQILVSAIHQIVNVLEKLSKTIKFSNSQILRNILSPISYAFIGCYYRMIWRH